MINRFVIASIIFPIIGSFLYGNPIDRSVLHKIDSVKFLLAQDLTIDRRIAENLKLASLYKFAHKNIDSLLDNSRDLATSNDLPFYVARVAMKRGVYELLNGQSAEGILIQIRTIDSVQKIIPNSLLPLWEEKLWFLYYLDIGDFSTAETHLQQWGDLIEQENYPGMWGPHYTYQGILYHKMKFYNKALNSFDLALDNTKPGETHIYNALASLHLEMEHLDLAKEYAESAINKGLACHDYRAVIEGEVLLGDIYFQRDLEDESIHHWEKAEKIRQEIFDYGNISALDRLVKAYWEDKEVIDSLLDPNFEFNSIPINSVLNIYRGLRSFELNQIEIGITFCQEGLRLAELVKNLEYGIQACDCLIQGNSKLNQVQNQIHFMTKKMNYQSDLNNRESIKSLANNLANYEFEQRKKVLDGKYKAERALLDFKLANYRVLLGIGALIILIIAFGIIQLRKRNKKIEKQNKIIQKALKEKEILLREIHHRVKNNLQIVSSLLTLQSNSSNSMVAKEAMMEGTNRIKSMALIHQNLYSRDNFVDINVQSYLEKLCAEIFHSQNINGTQIKFESDIDKLFLDIDTMVPLGLIINELITNAIKYAFQESKNGLIRVELKSKNKDYHLRIMDNGIGRSFDMDSKNTFGTHLVLALVEQLEGELTYDNTNGTDIHILFNAVSNLNKIAKSA